MSALIVLLVVQFGLRIPTVQAIMFEDAKKRGLVLNTVPISHYAEKVRFCMDYTGIEYEEEQDCGLVGILSTGRTVPTLMVPSR